MRYCMISYHVPPDRLPDAYGGKPPGVAAPASQKNYASLYLLGVC